MSNSANEVSLAAMLHEVYEPGLEDQLNPQMIIWNLFEKSKTARYSGKKVKIGLEIGHIASSYPGGLGDYLPEPETYEVTEAEIFLTRQYTTTNIDGLFEELTKDNEHGDGAYEEEIEASVKRLKHAHKRSLNRQAHLDRSGKVATVSSFDDSGSPITVTLAEDHPFIARFFVKNTVICFGSVNSSLQSTVSVAKGVWKITKVRSSTKTLEIVPVGSASVDPANGDALFFGSKANIHLTGLAELVGNRTAPVQGVDPANVADWLPVRDANGGTPRDLSLDILRRAHNAVVIESGSDGPTHYVTSLGHQRLVYNELKENVRYSSPDNLTAGNYNVVMWGNTKLVGDYQTHPNKAWGIDASEVKVYQTGPVSFMNQGGDKRMRTERKDEIELALRQYVNLGTRQRNAHVEIADLATRTT